MSKNPGRGERPFGRRRNPTYRTPKFFICHKAARLGGWGELGHRQRRRIRTKTPLKADGTAQTLILNSRSIGALAVSHDGTRVLAGYVDGTIAVWEGSPLVGTRGLVGHSGAVRGLAITSDGRRAVSCAADWHKHQDASVRLWNVETRQEVLGFKCWNFANLSVAISPDDRQVLVGGQLVDSRGL